MQNLAYPLLCLLLAVCQTQPDKASNLPREYILDELDLVPEGIAYSQQTDAFYLTSVSKSKIVKVDRVSGQQEDFIGEHGSGYMPGVGIYVEEEKNLLHAIGGYYLTDDSLTSVFTYDLNTRKLVRRLDVTDSGKHFLNDMIMDRVGNMYFTDSKDSSVYIARSGKNRLEKFFKSPEIVFPNGIAISDDNSMLYVASMPKGVRILDIKTKTILNEADTLEQSQGIDGLEFHKGHLYGIQNGIMANSFNFRKLILNEAKDAIVDIEIIDSHNPELDVPLTFCLVNEQAVVIGNSNLQHLDQVTFEFNSNGQAAKTKLLVYELN